MNEIIEESIEGVRLRVLGQDLCFKMNLSSEGESAFRAVYFTQTDHLVAEVYYEGDDLWKFKVGVIRNYSGNGPQNFYTFNTKGIEKKMVFSENDGQITFEFNMGQIERFLGFQK